MKRPWIFPVVLSTSMATVATFGASYLAFGYDFPEPARETVPVAPAGLKAISDGVAQIASATRGALVFVSVKKNARPQTLREGPGFPPGILARAFEPYVTAKPKGTGLGLAIVRKMVDEQGARITLENRFDANGVICGAQVEITFTRIAV
jgi:signal transduction histidine kinase